MSLSAIECDGYKAFAHPTRLGLRRLTVIFGKNNSGKTTLARLPLFLTASLASRTFYALETHGIVFGSSFPELASLDQPHPRIMLGVEWAERQRLAATLQYVTSSDAPESVELLSIDLDGAIYKWPLRDVTTPPVIGDAARFFREDQPMLGRRQQELAAILEATLHVPSARPAIAATYTTREPKGLSVGEVPYILASNRGLLSVVDQWSQEEFKIGPIAVDKAAFAFRLAGKEGRSLVNLANVGRGTQSVLPVAALLLGVATGQLDAQMVIVEEPEAHLHPSAHGLLADLAIDASVRAQVLVETHSENFVLRLRRRIADGRLPCDGLHLVYVDEKHSLREVVLDRFGSTDNWPHGVFESDIEEAEAIVQAKLDALRGAG